jgi:hypothetical protein
MGAMAGGEEPAAGIRVSDSERDAAVERLSAATGDGWSTPASVEAQFCG